jgi:hypothetical protein
MRPAPDRDEKRSSGLIVERTARLETYKYLAVVFRLWLPLRSPKPPRGLKVNAFDLFNSIGLLDMFRTAVEASTRPMVFLCSSRN